MKLRDLLTRFSFTVERKPRYGNNENRGKLPIEVETLNEKLHELTEEEFAQVTGGVDPGISKMQREVGGPGIVKREALD